MNIMNNNIIVSIEGNIGSGKSTLLTNLKQQYKTNDKIIFVDEPVKEWSKIRDTDNKNII
jgi:deoxyadenosine/deoxycytidine kinase